MELPSAEFRIANHVSAKSAILAAAEADVESPPVPEPRESGLGHRTGSTRAGSAGDGRDGDGDVALIGEDVRDAVTVMQARPWSPQPVDPAVVDPDEAAGLVEGAVAVPVDGDLGEQGFVAAAAGAGVPVAAGGDGGVVHEGAPVHPEQAGALVGEGVQDVVEGEGMEVAAGPATGDEGLGDGEAAAAGVVGRPGAGDAVQDGGLVAKRGAHPAAGAGSRGRVAACLTCWRDENILAAWP